jgi:hypothetical protein
MNTNKKSFNSSEIVRRGLFSLEAAQKVLAEGYSEITINRDGQPSLVSRDGSRINVWDYPRTFPARGQIVAWCVQAGLRMTGAGAPKVAPKATGAPAPTPTPVAAVAAPAVKFEEVKQEEPKVKKAKAAPKKAKKAAKPKKVKAAEAKAYDDGADVIELFNSFDIQEPDFGPDLPGVTINW